MALLIYEICIWKLQMEYQKACPFDDRMHCIVKAEDGLKTS